MVKNWATPEEASSLLQVAAQTRGPIRADRCRRYCMLTSAACRSVLTIAFFMF